MAKQYYLNILEKGAKIWNKFREENPEEKIDLEGIDFKMKVLWHYNFRDVNFKHCRFNYCDIAHCGFSRSDFTNGNITESVLRGCSFNETVLINVNLWSSYFSFCNFENTDFRNSRFTSTSFLQTDLSVSKNLEHVNCEGVCNIDLFSIFNNDKLPDQFLKKIGCQGDLIEVINSYRKQSIDYDRLFISYSRKDLKFVKFLSKELEKREIKYWLDEKDILVGQNISEQIENEIEFTDRVLICVSNNSINSNWVNYEISKTLDRERKYWQKKHKSPNLIIPIIIEKNVDIMNSINSKEIMSRKYIDFSSWEEFNSIELNRIMKEILNAINKK